MNPPLPFSFTFPFLLISSPIMTCFTFLFKAKMFEMILLCHSLCLGPKERSTFWEERPRTRLDLIFFNSLLFSNYQESLILLTLLSWLCHLGFSISSPHGEHTPKVRMGLEMQWLNIPLPSSWFLPENPLKTFCFLFISHQNASWKCAKEENKCEHGTY
jgi:hypothetical protein